MPRNYYDVFKFKFEIGLSPNIKVNLNFKNSVIYHKINIENKIIEERIVYLQQQYGELKDEKKISDISELMFEFSSKEENIDKNMTLKLNQLKTKKIVDLVLKLNLYETFTFELKEFFKDETMLTNLSNKTIEEIKISKINVEAKLISIQKRVNASLEESFFKKIYPNKSIKTLTQFKEEIKKSIQSQYDQQSDQKFLNDVTKKLIQEVKFDLPRKFLIKWLQKRDEKEITDINNTYLRQNKLKLNLLNRNTSWIDTGTYGSLIKASKFFEEFENKTSKKVACIEEIALNMKYIDKSQLKVIAMSMINSDYGKYLLNLV